MRPSTLPPAKTINNYLPSELLREIFLYSIESNQIKSGHLVSICRHWRSIITTMSHLWSTLRVGTWTEREQVITWLQRAYPKKVIIDPQRDRESLSDAPAFVALQDALESTGQWHELTISSFPPEEWASQLGFQVATPMNVLKVLHVASECSNSPPVAHLLDLVPTEAPLSELRLYSSFASAYFFQSLWFPVLQNLTVLIVNGRDIHEPFELLPAFTRLNTFEADHLPIPWYELDTNFPLLCTLHKLQLRASSVQWMAGREFPCLEECVILLPRHWEAVQQHEVHLPSCGKFTYHGYPMTTAQYFLVPQMKTMGLRSHDCKEQRVFQQLRHLCTLDGRISKLTTLHLTLQCSEKVFFKVAKYMGLLQELDLSIFHPSLSWKHFLESLAAISSTKVWPEWASWKANHRRWAHSSQTWHANILPHLKYLGIHCPRGFLKSECLDNSLLLRLVGWTRAQLTPPLEHLQVWDRRGIEDDIVVDYISTGCLDKHLGIAGNKYDSMIVGGMDTQHLVIYSSATPLFQRQSTLLFRWLQDLEVIGDRDLEILILPCLEQIRRLVIWHGIIPAAPLNSNLPLVHTLQWLRLGYSTFHWMLGRTFKVLKTFRIRGPRDEPENLSRHEGLLVNLPACTTLELRDISVNHLLFLSYSNIQTLEWWQLPTSKAAVERSQDFLYNYSCLQELEIYLCNYSGIDSLIRFLFCDSRKQGAWRDIRSVQVTVACTSSSRDVCFSQMARYRQYYKKWWEKLIVTMEEPGRVRIRASI